MTAELYLYSTAGCHLCNDAMDIIQLFTSSHDFSLTVIDIAESEELFKRYGTSIPVVSSTNSISTDTSELFWPFDAEEFCLWFHQNASL